jgi:hypothetical protein
MAWVRKNASMTLHILSLLDVHGGYKILFFVHLEHYTFWPSADVIPISNGLVHSMP